MTGWAEVVSTSSAGFCAPEHRRREGQTRLTCASNELPPYGMREPIQTTAARSRSAKPTRTRTLLLCVAALVLSSLISSCTKGGLFGAGGKKAPERIVLIVVDTLRRDSLSVYGSSWKTDTVAALAERGQVFPNAFGSFHQTSMSMGAMFTGRTPSMESGDRGTPLQWSAQTWCGMARLQTAEEFETCIPQSVPGLAERLRDERYETIGIASNPLVFGNFGMKRGFDHWTEVGQTGLLFGATPEQKKQAYRSRRLEEVNRSVITALESRRSDRFFLYVHYMDVHDREFDRRYAYKEAVEQVDLAIQEVLDFLDERGLLEGTTILLTSDHGERGFESHLLPGLPRHRGNPSFHEVVAIPLVVAPAVVDDPAPLIRTEDLFRLVLDIAAAPKNPEAESDLEPDELFFTEDKYLTYQRGRFKSFYERESERMLLVDLQTDPGEKRDVGATYPKVLSRYLQRTMQLADKLSATDAAVRGVDPSDLETLRVLGYVD